MMLDKRREETWYGGVVRARQYDSQGRHRPDIAAWILKSGLLVAARAVPPGEGTRALAELLRMLLEQGRGPRITRLALESASLLDSVRGVCALPTRVEPHWGFAIVVEDNQPYLEGLGYEQGYVQGDIDVALAGELFEGWSQFLDLDLVQPERPRLCAVDVPGVGKRTVWIGYEPAFLGNGLRVFRDMNAYRTYMHVNVQLDWVWERGDDASILGLETRALRWLNASQRRDLERHRLPLREPGYAPCVIATDREDVDRPYGAGDVRALIEVTRALNGAFAPRGRYTGAGRRGEVWLRHPEATEADLALAA